MPLDCGPITDATLLREAIDARAEIRRLAEHLHIAASKLDGLIGLMRERDGRAAGFSCEHCDTRIVVDIDDEDLAGLLDGAADEVARACGLDGDDDIPAPAPTVWR